MGEGEMEQDGIAALRDFLSTQSPGPIEETRKVPDLLSGCWSAFSGSAETNMGIDKLSRLEEPTWEPPCLSFLIERHGQTVMGSSRATVYKWQIDIHTLTASIIECKHRQLKPMAKRLDVKPIAEELVKAITRRTPDERLKVMDDGNVQLVIGKIILATTLRQPLIDAGA